MKGHTTIYDNYIFPISACSIVFASAAIILLFRLRHSFISQFRVYKGYIFIKSYTFLREN